MVLIHKNFFRNDIINYICNLPIVIKEKEELETSNLHSKYFSINVTPEIQEILFEKLGLNLTNVPMRWIKGDTKPHIDHGESTFDNTYLVYLTNSKGEFLIENEYFSIEKNTCYIFSEGIRHETINTGSIPRLLLGPMSESGFAVGSSAIIADGATDTIYIKYDTTYYYKINDGSYINLDSPITIINSNISSTLKILFETDILVYNQLFYFVCGSDNIQFGSTSLNTNGSRPMITIDGVDGYSGLINNGSSFSNGFNNIYIFNIEIATVNGSTLVSNGGWIGQEYFAKGSTNCYIINCSSDGPIIDAGGGIVGGYAASGSGNLKIISCSSGGNLAEYSGGIVGYYAGQDNGNIDCEMCWSTGIIGGEEAGGIFGYAAGDNFGTMFARYCYSTGLINPNGGGIFGREAATNSGVVTAEYCYSRGNISSNAGGIFGSNADSNTISQNCYSTGTITTTGNGIYGTNPVSGFTETNCYSANGTWDTETANENLSGVPTGVNIIGDTWVATTLNQPYELLNMGYTPYTINNIILIEGDPDVKRTSTDTINPNTSTEAAIVSGRSYTILEKSGGDSGSYSTITIDSTTGVISTTSSTILGTYTLYIRNTGSYNITEFNLIISGSPPRPYSRPNNSFAVYNVFLENLENSIAIAEIDNTRVNNRSFAIYDTLLQQLVNEALINR